MTTGCLKTIIWNSLLTHLSTVGTGGAVSVTFCNRQSQFTQATSGPQSWKNMQDSFSSTACVTFHVVQHHKCLWGETESIYRYPYFYHYWCPLCDGRLFALLDYSVQLLTLLLLATSHPNKMTNTLFVHALRATHWNVVWARPRHEDVTFQCLPRLFHINVGL